MAERRRRPTREELDERLRFVLGKIPVSVIEGVRREPEITQVAHTPQPEPAGGNGAANGASNGNANGASNGNGASSNGNGRIVGGRIKAAGES